MDARFYGKQALVTGGGSGIGKAIADALQLEGCDVITAGVHPHCGSLELDVTNSDAVDEVVAQMDRLDILINAAGIILRDGREHEIDNFERVVDVNLNGVMRMAGACHDLLALSKGCVLNVASMLSFFGSGYAPAYSASKGGIVQLTKSLAIAWAPDQIRVNAIAPGWIETAMTEPLSKDEDRKQQIIERTPMRRWGRPEDVAPAALFLCSDQAAFITGAVLAVDGGYSVV